MDKSYYVFYFLLFGRPLVNLNSVHHCDHTTEFGKFVIRSQQRFLLFQLVCRACLVSPPLSAYNINILYEPISPLYTLRIVHDGSASLSNCCNLQVSGRGLNSEGSTMVTIHSLSGSFQNIIRVVRCVLQVSNRKTAGTIHARFEDHSLLSCARSHITCIYEVFKTRSYPISTYNYTTTYKTWSRFKYISYYTSYLKWDHNYFIGNQYLWYIHVLNDIISICIYYIFMWPLKLKETTRGMELLVVQYCQEDADFNKKDHQDQTKNAKVMRVQNFPNFDENFTQFLTYAVCWCEYYIYKRGKNFTNYKLSFGKIFGGIFLFFENIFGGHFYISQFVPL